MLFLIEEASREGIPVSLLFLPLVTIIRTNQRKGLFMGTLLASFTLGLIAHGPINTLPPKRKEDALKLPVYAIYEDNRIVLWKKITKQDPIRPYRQDVSFEPFCIN